MFTLCDHSIAHPGAVEALVNNMGKMPSPKVTAEISPFWEYIRRDIERADAVLVNSHFVKDSFRAVGDASLVHVIYLGVDDAFLKHVPRRKNPIADLRVLFGGKFEKRKGADIIISALKLLVGVPWNLEIAGPLDTGIVEQNREFFSDQRVKYLGLLSRRDLAIAMSKADVFLFPSLAEGSARVVFEALACGCYVITTPNSGSIVENGINGRIVQPGDSLSLAEAVEYAHRHRDEIAKAGYCNAELVKRKFTQICYGEQLSSLYQEVLRSNLGS